MTGAAGAGAGADTGADTGTAAGAMAMAMGVVAMGRTAETMGMAAAIPAATPVPGIAMDRVRAPGPDRQALAVTMIRTVCRALVTFLFTEQDARNKGSYHDK